MVFFRKDLLRRALEKGPNLTPNSPEFRQAVESTYFEEYEVQKENISLECYEKLNADFFEGFCIKMKTFYNEKKAYRMPERMISNHKKYFETAVPTFASFVPVEPEPQPLPVPMEMDVASGDSMPKKSLQKSRIYQVNMAVELICKASWSFEVCDLVRYCYL